jgi:outer membrane protein insertion porin family
MNITFKAAQSPRVYVERIDITGNTVTRDKVLRREFRINEGDAFNALKVKRSEDRIKSLGYFQEKFEIKQTEGSAPDRIVLGANVEEKSTGQISLSGGYSSLERFVVQLAVSQNNFRGMGQSVDAGVNWSRYAKSVQVGFTEPYFLDKPILMGVQLYRRDYDSFQYTSTGSRNTTYSQLSNGGSIRTGFPVTEYLTAGFSYSLVNDKVSLDKGTFYTDPDGTGPLPSECDPIKAGRYLCDEIGTHLTSRIGHSILYDDTNGDRPTRGQRLVLSQDFAGLGGDIKYLRTRLDATKYHGFGAGWVASLHGEGGYIAPLQKSPGPGRDAIRLTDRFFGPQLRGFDIRGIGPRILRYSYNADGTLGAKSDVSDALGGRAYYMGRLELEFPVSSQMRSLGLRPSAFIDVGSLWNITKPELTDVVNICVPTSGSGTTILQHPGDPACNPTVYTITPGIKEVFVGNSVKPRLSIGIGVNWNSPFGPLRIDLAKALLKQEGDDTKLFSFNVGTSF